MSKISQPDNAYDKQNTAQKYLLAAWSLSAITSLLAIIAWGNNYEWQLFPVNNYQLFPLLGLLAFSLMWSHYMVGAVSDMADVAGRTFRNYFKYTGYLVLALICLHPGLLIYQLFRDGAGLPPSSYQNYVAPGLAWVTLLGTASFVAFIAFEFRRVFGNKSWWHFVTEAGDVAMLAVLYHGLRLGGELTQDGWYKLVWLFYAVTLVAVLVRSYRKTYFTDFTRKKLAQ